jgi:hypothetical protein
MQPSASILPNLHTPPTLLQGCPCAISATKPEKRQNFDVAQDNRHIESSIRRRLARHCSSCSKLFLSVLQLMRVCRRYLWDPGINRVSPTLSCALCVGDVPQHQYHRRQTLITPLNARPIEQSSLCHQCLCFHHSFCAAAIAYHPLQSNPIHYRLRLAAPTLSPAIEGAVFSSRQGRAQHGTVEEATCDWL